MAEADHADDADHEIDDEIDDEEEERLIREGLREIWQRAQPEQAAALTEVLGLLDGSPTTDAVGLAVERIHRVAGTIGVLGLVDECHELRAVEERLGAVESPDEALLADARGVIGTVHAAVESHTP